MEFIFANNISDNPQEIGRPGQSFKIKPFKAWLDTFDTDHEILKACFHLADTELNTLSTDTSYFWFNVRGRKWIPIKAFSTDITTNSLGHKSSKRNFEIMRWKGIYA